MKYLFLYTAVHFISLLIFSYREYVVEESIYSVFIRTTNNNGLHLFHAAFLILLLFISGKLLVTLFLDGIRSEEQSTINDNCFMFLTDTLLIISIFSEDISIKNLILFCYLLTLKCLAWVFSERVTQQNDRMVISFGLLIIMQSLTSFILSLKSSLEEPNVQILFTFEYGIVTLTCIKSLISMFLEDSIKLFWVDITYVTLKLVAHIFFFCFTTMHYRIPFNVFRECFSTFKTLFKKINNFRAFLKISKYLETCPTVSTGTCAICTEDMEEEKGRIIKCKHSFHLVCLKRWVEQQQVCPICRDVIMSKEGDKKRGAEGSLVGIPVSAA
ncbi:E3 ubiquitin ligase [Trachipleistophora hominis]|uniref:E3 ubiquitin ligase n=1 Tax=Trachipleistophora hominis TaxID=72359 RepID=L7JXH6_TRAHO|nr:E3 ubiquitin ligase [Trachipleistophora hominis]